MPDLMSGIVGGLSSVLFHHRNRYFPALFLSGSGNYGIPKSVFRQWSAVFQRKQFADIQLTGFNKKTQMALDGGFYQSSFLCNFLNRHSPIEQVKTDLLGVPGGGFFMGSFFFLWHCLGGR